MFRKQEQENQNKPQRGCGMNIVNRITTNRSRTAKKSAQIIAHNYGLKRARNQVLAHAAIRGLRLRMYWCLWIRSARRTVICWVIPARSKSAWSVAAFRVFLSAIQKLSLKWLIDFSTVTRILYVSSHSSVPLTVPGKARKLFSG